MDKKTIERLCSYSMVKSLYEYGYNDYLDCLVPIVIQVFPDEGFADMDFIQRELDTFFPIQTLMLQQIFTKALEENLLVAQAIQPPNKQNKNKKNVEYRLSQKAKHYFYNERKQIQKRIKALTKDIEKFFINKLYHPGLDKRNLVSTIQTFIDNCGFLCTLGGSSVIDVNDAIKIESRDMELILQYLQKTRHENIEHIHTFLEVVMGYIIAMSLEWTDLASVNTVAFRNCILFLDTNFTFSVLKLHGPQIRTPIIELFNETIYFDFKPKIFDFTLQQIRNVLQNYSEDKVSDEITENELKEGSVYEILKHEWKWGKKHVKDYADNLENILQDKGIEIYDTGLNLINNHPPGDNQLAELFDIYGELFAKRKFKYPSNSNSFGKQHDIAAIKMIQDLRGGPVIFDNPKAFFLTSDRKLVEFNQYDMIREEKGTLPEVVLDTRFESMLWVLGKGKSNINFSIDTIVAAYSKNPLIKSKVWERFLVIFKKMMDDDNINPANLPHLFYANIGNMLNEFSDKNISGLTKGFVQTRISESQKREDSQKEQREALGSLLEEQKAGLNSLQLEFSLLQKENTEIKGIISKRTKIIGVLVILLIIVSTVSLLFLLN